MAWEKENAKRVAELKKTCKSRSLKDKIPAVKDQGKFGWCFAYAASALVSFKLKTDVSASDIALGYYDSDYQEFLNKTLTQSEKKERDLKVRIPAMSAGYSGAMSARSPVACRRRSEIRQPSVRDEHRHTAP